MVFKVNKIWRINSYTTYVTTFPRLYLFIYLFIYFLNWTTYFFVINRKNIKFHATLVLNLVKFNFICLEDESCVSRLFHVCKLRESPCIIDFPLLLILLLHVFLIFFYLIPILVQSLLYSYWIFIGSFVLPFFYKNLNRTFVEYSLP